MTETERFVFTVGAHLPNGGARTAHRIARLAAQAFGFTPVCVAVSDDRSGYAMFGDEEITLEMTPAQMLEVASSKDLLICNPSFSWLDLGRSFPGRSLCYVQHVNTFGLLDVHLKKYVAVSRLVRDYLRAVYELDTYIIPPYVTDVERVDVQPWAERDDSMLVFLKGASPLQASWLESILDRIRSTNPNLKIEVVSSYSLQHVDFLRYIARFKFFMAFSALEGFGLMPLEAMGVGLVVVGLNGVGGRDYMRPGENCAPVSLKDIDLVVPRVNEMIRDVEACKAMSQRARETALSYSVDLFDRRWVSELEVFLGEARYESIHPYRDSSIWDHSGVRSARLPI